MWSAWEEFCWVACGGSPIGALKWPPPSGDEKDIDRAQSKRKQRTRTKRHEIGQDLPSGRSCSGSFCWLGAYSLVLRFVRGLGASTNLSDAFPWGLWVGFKLFVGGIWPAADSRWRRWSTSSISGAIGLCCGPSFLPLSSATRCSSCSLIIDLGQAVPRLASAGDVERRTR